MKVVPFQCLGCVWSQRDKKENLSPTISATISQFNAVTNRVITSLLCPSTSPSSTPSSMPNQRARIIERWIRVAQVRSAMFDCSLKRIYFLFKLPDFTATLCSMLDFHLNGQPIFQDFVVDQIFQD